MRRRRSPNLGPSHRQPVSFDDETHAEISALADLEGVSRSEKIRQLVEWGLEAERTERPRDANR